jgi:hypothetical protein
MPLAIPSMSCFEWALRRGNLNKGHVIGERRKKYYLLEVFFECHYAYKIGIWAQKVEKVNFHLLKMVPKGVIEKNEKVLKTPLSTHIS